MVQPQNETYTLIIERINGTKYLILRMDRSTGFDLFEKITGIYAFGISGPNQSEYRICLHKNFLALSTKALVREMWVYPDKLQDLIQYCQPKLF